MEGSLKPKNFFVILQIHIFRNSQQFNVILIFTKSSEKNIQNRTMFLSQKEVVMHCTKFAVFMLFQCWYLVTYFMALKYFKVWIFFQFFLLFRRLQNMSSFLPLKSYQFSRSDFFSLKLRREKTASWMCKYAMNINQKCSIFFRYQMHFGFIFLPNFFFCDFLQAERCLG